MTPEKAAEEAAEELIGTCQGIDDLSDALLAFRDDPKFCEKLDELCFECECCGWWFPTEECADDETGICKECFG